MFDIKAHALNITVNDKIFREDTFQKRTKIISIAIDWPGETTKGRLKFNNIWTYKQSPKYVVSLGKYGKEFYEKDRNGVDIKNRNDMRPAIICDGKLMRNVRGGFNDIFHLMEKCKKEGQDDVLKAFAVLFLRNAFLLDHSIMQEKYYVYKPDENLIEFICKHQPTYENVPMEVYIHFLDAIGLNEDVKYFTKGKLTRSSGIGRENNMRTYVYNICCNLGLMDWSEYTYKLITTQGVASIPYSDIEKFFPELGFKYNAGTPRGSKATSTEEIVEFINQEYPKDTY